MTNDEIYQLEMIHGWLVGKFDLKEGEAEEMEKVIKKKGLGNIIEVLKFERYNKKYEFYTVEKFFMNYRRTEAEKYYIKNCVSGRVAYSELTGFQRI